MLVGKRSLIFNPAQLNNILTKKLHPEGRVVNTEGSTTKAEESAFNRFNETTKTVENKKEIIKKVLDLSKFRSDIDNISERVFRKEYEYSPERRKSTPLMVQSDKKITRREFMQKLITNHSPKNSLSPQHTRVLSVTISNVNVNFLAKLLKVNPRVIASKETVRMTLTRGKSLDASIKSNQNTLMTSPIRHYSTDKITLPDRHSSLESSHRQRNLSPENAQQNIRSPKKGATVAAFWKSFSHSDNTPTFYQSDSTAGSLKHRSKHKRVATFMNTLADDKKMPPPQQGFNRSPDKHLNFGPYNWEMRKQSHDSARMMRSEFSAKSQEKQTSIVKLSTNLLRKGSLQQGKPLLHLHRPNLSSYSESKNSHWRESQSKGGFACPRVRQQRHLN